MTLRLSEMPTSFAGEAMAWAATKTWLSPSSPLPLIQAHGRFRRVIENGLTRFLALQIFAVGAAIVCTIPGVVWHGARALQYKISAHRNPNDAVHLNALSYEHLKAGLIDLTALFRSIVYPLAIESDGGGRAMTMWFSSTPVQTEYVGPPVMINVDNFTSAAWGGDSSNFRAFPMDRLKRAVVDHFCLSGRNCPINHREVLLRAIVNNTFDVSGSFWRSKKQFFHSPSTLSSLSPGNTSAPPRRFPWKVVAWAVGVVAAIILACLWIYFCSLVLGKILISMIELMKNGGPLIQIVAFGTFFLVLLLPSAFFGGAIPMSGIQCYEAIRAYLQQRRADLTAYAQNLIRPQVANPPNPPLDPEQALANAKGGLFWLKEAADGRYDLAQFEYGLFLLAALAHYEEIPDATQPNGVRIQSRGRDSLDDEEILLAREAVARIQAGILNRFVPLWGNEGQMLTGALGLTGQDIQDGYSGSTEVGKSRSLLRNFSFDPIVRHFFTHFPEKDVRDRVVGVLREAVGEVQERKRKRITARIVPEIASNTPLIPDVARMIADYAYEPSKETVVL